MEEIKKSNVIEKHIQTILLTLITGGIIWAASSLQDTKERIIKMEERDQVKTERLNQMQGTLNKLQLDMYDQKERLTIMESKQKR